MEVKPFDSFPITTMTLVFPFEGCVDIHKVVHLLPWTNVDIRAPKRCVKKLKLPKIGIPGAIISVRFERVFRGLIRTASENSFSNSIMIDIGTTDKFVSVKLSADKIHVTGAISEENGQEAAQYILEHIDRIQNMLIYLRENKEEVQTTIDWIISASRGKAELKQTKVLPNRTGKFQLFHMEDVEDYHLPNKTEVLNEIPDNVDPTVADFFLDYINDFIYHSDFVKKINWINETEAIHDQVEPLKISKMIKAMVNYNYCLGFQIDRNRLSELVNGSGGFFARFNNVIDHSVKIEFPYVPSEDRALLKKTRKRGNVSCHTFMIYMSGRVTQSGPDQVLMREIYYRLMEIIKNIYTEIKIEE